MRALVHDYFARHPELSLAVLAPRAHEPLLDLKPWGAQAAFLPAEANGALCEQYLRLNHHAFGRLPLPRWVLSDLYLLPGAIGLMMGPARLMEPGARAAVEARPEAQVILAAYVAAPSIEPGRFIGVSLMSFVPNLGAGAWIKALTLRMLGARTVRGVAQWRNPSVRVHTRLGPLRVVGRVPGGHELSNQSFVYDCAVDDEAQLRACMTRSWPSPPVERIASDDVRTLTRRLEEAEAGARHVIAPPGLDEADHILFVKEPSP